MLKCATFTQPSIVDDTASSMEQNNISLAENFQKYFSVELATTPAQKKDVYGVRYRVYCEELKYEPPENFPDQQETDQYDQQSIHLLVRHKKTNKPAGCVRVVESKEDGFTLLPFEENFPEALDQEFFSRTDLDRDSCCEISRLAIDKLFRRRTGESFSRLGDLHAMDITAQEYRTFSLIAEAEFMAAAAITQMSGRNNIFALMEPYLCRLLGRSGIYFIKVGKSVEHHGLRAPYYVTIESILKNLRPELLELYQSIYSSLEDAFQSYRQAA